jgi:hypothetical protein
MDRKLTKPQLIACIILGSALFSSLIFMLEFSPVSLHVKPYVNLSKTDIDDLQLKTIVAMEIVGNPKVGFNTLMVSWPVWSDCGPVGLEVVQYDMFQKEINIQIWGTKGSACPQVIAFVDHSVELFIPLPGYWKITCNNRSISINI